MHCCTFSLRFVWFWAICNGLPRVTVKFIKYIYTIYIYIFHIYITYIYYIYIYANIFLKKLTVNCGNPLQIAQNQANLRENVW